ncbi:MAG TPA: hypothetical protein PK431_12745 [Chitinophagales bacterium]|nr:hypothetical protein [Chitinophagales bacterium]
MKNTFKILILSLMIISIDSFAQVIPVGNISSSNTTTFQQLTQKEIENILSPSEGFIAFNKTTNCVNYYLNNQWNELCGSCIPKPPVAPDIESIVVDDLDIIIYFKKNDTSNINQELNALLLPDSILTYTTTNQIIFKNVVAGNHVVKYYFKNKCGNGISRTSPNIEIQPKDICGNFELEFNQQQIPINTFINKCWFTSDVTSVPNVNAKDVFISKEGNYYYNAKILINNNVCPVGWHLPNLKDAEELSNYLLGNEARIAKFSPSLNGSYSPKEKLVNYGTGSAYWIKDGNTEKVFVVNKLGTMIVDVTKQNVYTTIRCVKD